MHGGRGQGGGDRVVRGEEDGKREEEEKKNEPGGLQVNVSWLLWGRKGAYGCFQVIDDWAGCRGGTRLGGDGARLCRDNPLTSARGEEDNKE